jgi:hypothetical protein
MNTVSTSQTTTSTTYTNLATTGPAVTLATDTSAIVIATAEISNNTASKQCKMGFAVSGATTMAASDTYATWATSAGANGIYQMSGMFYVTGLTAGNNTFTAKYAAVSNTCTFVNRTLIVIAQASVATCSDTTPDAFSFTNQTNVSTSTLTNSDIIQLSGFNCTVNTAISGSGSPAYRTCSDSGCSTVVQDWTTGASSIASGQYIQARLTSSSTGGVQYNAVLIAGNGSTSWGVATAGDCSGSPAVGTGCSDGTVYAGQSADGNVKMYVTRCNAGQTWNSGTSTCDGSAWTLNWNNGTTNWTDTGYYSANTGRANTTGLAALADAGSPHNAAQYCENLDEDGHTDWYLPAKNELATIYGGKAAIGNFINDWYWTSTENYTDDAWSHDFTDGSQSLSTKSNALYVRCARR